MSKNTPSTPKTTPETVRDTSESAKNLQGAASAPGGRIEIYDTTLRDGTQGEGVSLSVQDKLLITRKLDELGVDFVEGGYPLSNPKDAEYFQRVRALALKHTKVAA